jgi:glyoxylase I family protein
MIRIRDIDHVVFRVRDLARALAFYRDVLGCAIEREQPAIGLWQLRAGRSLIDLVPIDGELGRAGGAPPGAEGRNVDHLCLRVEPWDEAAIREHLASHGVAPEASRIRFGADGAGPSFYLTDPDGNTIELKGPPA